MVQPCGIGFQFLAGGYFTGLTLSNLIFMFEEFYYVYILRSQKDNQNYAGYTKDLQNRFEQHQNGLVESTKYRRPLKLIYFECCLNQSDALKREKYLKTHYGKMFLKNRLKNWFNDNK